MLGEVGDGGMRYPIGPPLRGGGACVYMHVGEYVDHFSVSRP